MLEYIYLSIYLKAWFKLLFKLITTIDSAAHSFEPCVILHDTNHDSRFILERPDGQ